ncbi:MAG: hypothetical protein ABI707_19985 [Ferruginibacter sp.]
MPLNFPSMRYVYNPMHLEVSLDFLVGKMNVEIDSKSMKRLQDIQKLNEQDKTSDFEMVDAFLRDRKAKKVYAS